MTLKPHDPSMTPSDTREPEANGAVASLEFSSLESPGGRHPIRYFSEVASTMEIARTLAADGVPHFTVVAADRQTQGRGRLSRNWLSADGGLYFTLILRPDAQPGLSFRFNLAASLVLARTLRMLHGIDAKVKWPNDVMAGGKKIAGILAEMESDEKNIKFLNIGIGVNVNNDPSLFEPGACSVASLIKKKTDKKKLLKLFLDDYEKFIRSSAMNDVPGEWKKETVTIGRPVEIVTIHNRFQGLATDMDQSGALILTCADGSEKKVIHGDCFHM